MKNGKRRKKAGTLLVIGGGEDRKGEARILSEVVRRTGEGKLCVVSVASKVGHLLWEEYRQIFHRLGARRVSHLDVVQRHETDSKRAHAALDGASTVFFTGGDQLRITSELGGTGLAEEITSIYEHGGLIAGTSAGASVMSETMLVGWTTEGSYKLGEGVKMAPGLGLLKNIIIDQHFSARQRIGRLLGAVALNPKYLGVGIDEDTSIVVEKGSFHVLGRGSAYVIDAHESTGTNVSESCPDRCLSISDVKCHVLCEPDRFDLSSRKVQHFDEEAA